MEDENNAKELALEIRRIATHLRHMESTIDSYIAIVNQLGEVIRGCDIRFKAMFDLIQALIQLLVNSGIGVPDHFFDQPEALRGKHQDGITLMNNLMLMGNKVKRENIARAHMVTQRFVPLASPAAQFKHVQRIAELLDTYAPLPEPTPEPPQDKEPIKPDHDNVFRFPKTPPTKH